MPSPNDHALALGLIAMHGRIAKRLGGALSPHGISVTEYLVLHQLAAAPKHRMRRVDLADSVGLSPSGVARLLKPMEKIGLVEKGEAARDARVSPVALTTGGERIYHETTVAFTHAARTLLGDLDRASRANLGAVVDAIG